MYPSQKRIFVLSFVLASLLISVVAGTTFAASTKEASAQGCHHLSVIPHAKQSPTITCLDHISADGAQSRSSSSCSTLNVTLYRDFDLQGDSICFGPGSANLTDYPGWNDQVSSWSTSGCSAFSNGLIRFTKDVNAQGDLQIVDAYPGSDNVHLSGNFTGTNYTLPNDSLSFVAVQQCSAIG